VGRAGRAGRGPAARELRALRDPGERRARSVCVAEGGILVAEALAAGLAPVAAFCTAAGLERDPEVASALARALPGPLGVQRVAPAVFAAASATRAPQGLLVVFRLPDPPAVADAPWILALDGVQDPGNVGAMARSLLAFGGPGSLLLTGPGTADPYGDKALRASAGAMFRLRHRQVDLAALLPALPGRRVALCPRGGVGPAAARLRPPLVLAVGAEGAGLSAAVAAICEPVTVPMPGRAESLNAAAAVAIVLYEAVRSTAGGSDAGAHFASAGAAAP